MEKCSRPSCNGLIDETKVEVAGRMYCSQECVDKCTDETCVCHDCGCATV